MNHSHTMNEVRKHLIIGEKATQPKKKYFRTHGAVTLLGHLPEHCKSDTRPAKLLKVVSRNDVR